MDEEAKWLRVYVNRNVPHGGARVRLLRIAGLLEEGVLGPSAVEEALSAKDVKLLPWQRRRLHGKGE